ncbi:hypothetical protein cypCar_00005450 [Cyprinus carpio]|nr:hypothetical protein cypCar_00005450 [Cyprinus carpio]
MLFLARHTDIVTVLMSQMSFNTVHRFGKRLCLLSGRVYSFNCVL